MLVETLQQYPDFSSLCIMDKSDHILDTQIQDAKECDRGIVIHLPKIQFLAE